MAREYLMLFSPFGAAALGIAAALFFAPEKHILPATPQIPQWQYDLNGIGPSEAIPVLSFAGMRPLTESPFFHDVPIAASKPEQGPSQEIPRLTMILSLGSESLCRINGLILRQGERGPGFKVANIADSHVEIIFDSGEKRLLYLDEISLESS